MMETNTMCYEIILLPLLQLGQSGCNLYTVNSGYKNAGYKNII
jgi:hypothetical protein